MAEGYTAFITYMLASETDTTINNFQGYGYSNPIHCNYIQKLTFKDKSNKEFNLYFDDDDVDYFKFLSVSGGTGFTAHKIMMLVQLVDNSSYESTSDVKSFSDKWVAFDVTDQISNYTSGQTLSASDICSAVYRVSIRNYNIKVSNGEFYDLSYLNYPSKIDNDDENSILCFGDESYFIGNVTTSIEAIAYTMDLGINLSLNEFNSSNNVTWDSELDDQVFISEVGVYDENKNLVGIAKLNNPIPKDSTISRTIVFAMDF